MSSVAGIPRTLTILKSGSLSCQNKKVTIFFPFSDYFFNNDNKMIGSQLSSK